MRTKIAIPMGDPAGVGPEIVVKTAVSKEILDLCDLVVIGDKNVLEKAIEICQVNLKIHTIKNIEEGKYEKGILNVIDLENVDMNTLEYGQVQGMCGKAAFEYIKKCVELAMEHKVDAIATTPINKESLKAGNINYIGHTEILGDLSNSRDPLTMFEVDNMRVFFLTRHMSLRRACDAITKERVLEYIERCTKALKQLGVSGKMAVAGLNPHSGEHGLFGDEEVKEITPAIEEAQKLGYDVVGPVGADSVFHQALQGRYAAVLSLYHDQGHIATKTYDFERTIAITLDMPFLRTSVDHGTAFDIAGKGIVSAVSMIEAVKLAAKYAPNFKNVK
ncbi:4-hydroxythreonine-4-phosphate dehydrogenase PdxA [Fusobacterium nucleatum]|jgi:4-hydroxythreonine-4-phosphate dehydrogenase|uniref:4-hydroxythreonine-4-phosphate dehydrogenase PdxA n=1 Tax=Fusobacterium TaxID=848 RepID=UPI000452399C|nr:MULTISPECIES: 4-hydroxythreonine-4-phosphate dehydrogenase PdxA [Fusobacterium]EUB34369.1 4-hydroxythreonine-4-phosphate dehydrogenase PdxA [Fusobacterium sp. OBRC1]WRL73871.1 4-hydroxythreonine-4-phosphate dehydrogenase PdxA [Fusobacterium polymorphum]BEO92388.1 4-hydroxythreonine-4-phosphate dehydrogenase PdxA [Fusobacterium nucleatum]BEP04463.1 4-hydroxythreonine-4-phosphate dehydrogenase PdxA [Fusobacterium nucleatum]